MRSMREPEAGAVPSDVPGVLPAPGAIDATARGEGGDLGTPGGEHGRRGLGAPARRSKSRGASPTERTLKALRDDGWTAAVVEKWNPHARVRNDLFGFIDVLALRGGEVLAVQATSRDNVSARINKIASEELDALVREVRDAGWRIEVWGWGKMASGRWECRRVNVS